MTEAVARVLQEAHDLDWRAWSMPPSTEWFSPETVPSAFESLPRACSESDARAAYNSMLDAIAHNHSGRLYAAAVPGAGLLAKLVPLLEGWPRFAATEVLTDLLHWAVDGERFVGPNGVTLETKREIHRSVATLVPELRQTAEGADACARAARELIEIYDTVTSQFHARPKPP